jgi:alkaline phosphatase D
MTSSSFNQIHPRGTPTENRYRADQTTYHQENFGVISIDWEGDDPSVTMQIRDIEGGVRIEKRIALKELQP